MQLDLIVVIARFDPVHAGHLQLLEQAKPLAPQMAILIGSAHRPRSARNPWTVAERQEQIESAWAGRPERLSFCGISDHLYSETRWADEVRTCVAGAAGGAQRIGILAGPQQSTAALRRLFPEWSVIEPAVRECIDGFQLREQIFQTQFDTPEALDFVRKEFAFLRDYRESWSAAPYPVNFVTVDALVTHRGQVLLIRRGNHPGRGLLALPGGFLDVNERIQDAAIRELREETGLHLAEESALAALRRQALFDVPDRSLRGRTITHVFHFDLPGEVQPLVAAADDAAQVQWTPFAAAMQMQDQFFEDHFDILESFFD